MKRTPKLVIRMGASVNSVTVAGLTFDRSTMNDAQRTTLRVMIREAFTEGKL